MSGAGLAARTVEDWRGSYVKETWSNIVANACVRCNAFVPCMYIVGLGIICLN